MNQSLAAVLIACGVWLQIAMLRADQPKPILSLYIFYIQFKYLLLEQLMGARFEHPAWMWLTMAAHLAVAVETCWQAIPYAKERSYALMSASCGGILAVIVILTGSSGIVTTYRDASRYLQAYYVQTGTCAAIVIMGWFTAVYCWMRMGARWRGPLSLALYFSSDVAVNAIWRYSPWRYATANLLVANHLWHLLIVAFVLWRLNALASQQHRPSFERTLPVASDPLP